MGDNRYRDYVVVIDDLRFRRAEQQRALAETEQALNAMERILSEIQRDSIKNTQPAQPAAGNTYAGMTLGDAAAALIRSVGPGRPQTTRQIVEGLQRGGVSTKSANLFTTMYNILSKRAERENGDIVKSGTGWTLRAFQDQ